MDTKRSVLAATLAHAATFSSSAEDSYARLRKHLVQAQQTQAIPPQVKVQTSDAKKPLNTGVSVVAVEVLQALGLTKTEANKLVMLALQTYSGNDAGVLAAAAFKLR